MDELASMEPATGRAVWKGSDLRQSDSWVYRLTSNDLAEVNLARAAVRDRNLPFQETTAADFPLPRLGDRLAVLADELENGRGFGVLRGFPVDAYDEDDCKIVSWGVCAHFGTGIPQSREGDWVNHVVDVSDAPAAHHPDLAHILRRGQLRTNHRGGELDFHTDTTDIFALFSLKKAKIGGESRLVSAGMLHNLILAEDPSYLQALYDGYYYMSQAVDVANNERRVSDQRVPVFRRHGSSVHGYYIPQVIQRAIDLGNVRYEPAADAARQAIQRLADTPGVAFEFMLEPGDLLLANNRAVMHARRDYEDHPDLDRRRHLLRLWMAVTPAMTSKTFRAPSDQFSY